MEGKGQGVTRVHILVAGAKDSCDINYSGSSPVMEVEGVKRIWLCSVEKLKLMYTSFISDGDSKGFGKLKVLKPYGDKAIVKHKCIGHVGKRLGTKLRKLVQLKKTFPDRKPAKFGTHFTSKTMDALGVFYGSAIRENIGDVDAMEKAIWTIFHHSASTDEDPQHQFCPVGEESWCKYQLAIALSQDIPPANNRIPPDLVQLIGPVFEELIDRELLDRCILGTTQSQN